MDDRFSFRALVSVGMHVGHHVMPQLSLVIGCDFQIEVVSEAAKLPDLLVGDLEAEPLLVLGQGNPERSPGPKPAFVAPHGGHFPRCVTGD